MNEPMGATLGEAASEKGGGQVSWRITGKLSDAEHCRMVRVASIRPARCLVFTSLHGRTTSEAVELVSF